MMMDPAAGNDSKQFRTSGTLLSPNGNNQQRLSIVSIKVFHHHKEEEFDNTIITTTPDSPIKSSSISRDVDSISGKSKNSKSNRITPNDSENAKNLSQNSSNTSDVDESTQVRECVC